MKNNFFSFCIIIIGFIIFSSVSFLPIGEIKAQTNPDKGIQWDEGREYNPQEWGAWPGGQKRIWSDVEDDLQHYTTDMWGPFSDSQQRHPAATMFRIIGVIYTILGTIFLILVIYGGFTWALSGGNQENVTKAKDIIKNGVIGAAIIVAAYSITVFIYRGLIGAMS